MTLSPNERRDATPTELIESAIDRIHRAPRAAARKGPRYQARRLRHAEKDVEQLTAALEDHYAIPSQAAYYALEPALRPLGKDLSAAISDAELLEARADSHHQQTGEPLAVDRIAPRELGPVRAGLTELKALLLELDGADRPGLEIIEAASPTYDRLGADGNEDREGFLARDLKREIRRRGGWVQQSNLLDYCEQNNLASRRTARERLKELATSGELEKRTDPTDKRRNQYTL